MGECWQMDANGIRQTDPFILARRTIDSASSSFETHFIHSRVAECAHGPHGLSLMRLNLLSSLKANAECADLAPEFSELLADTGSRNPSKAGTLWHTCQVVDSDYVVNVPCSPAR